MSEAVFTPSKRRGRPPAAATVEPNAEAPSGDRRRRKSVGGLALKLSAPVRPGFVRRWANDDNNRIAQLDDLAYDRVQGEAPRLVGTKPNGEPLHAYLMETPEDEYAHGLADKEAHNRKVDEAIRDGRDSTGQHNSDGYVGQGSIKVG